MDRNIILKLEPTYLILPGMQSVTSCITTNLIDYLHYMAATIIILLSWLWPSTRGAGGMLHITHHSLTQLRRNVFIQNTHVHRHL